LSDESLLPFLSRFDPAESSEGSLDPLGLYSMADALGVRLAPGVRERQRNPRFLTLALVGMAARARAGIADAAPSGLPAWLVYEWVVVESLVGRLLAPEGSAADAQGIPGRDKVLASLRAKDALSVANYLKSPAVFGFHGIYKVLGTKSRLFDAAGRVGEAGLAVLRGWEADNQLHGFVEGEGPGVELSRAIAKAVERGLDKGCSQMSGRRGGLADLVCKYLDHRQPGEQEGNALWSALLGDALRREVLELLTSAAGQAAWTEAVDDEAAMHAWMRERASPELRAVLAAVAAIERLFRLLTDAFDEVRAHLHGAGAIAFSRLAEGMAMQQAAQASPDAFAQARARLDEVDPSQRAKLESALAWTSESHAPSAFAQALLAHHEGVQRGKPPNGKRSWFDTWTDGRIAVRPAYALHVFEPRPRRYVHQYRLVPLWSFAVRMGRVQAVGATGEDH